MRVLVVNAGSSSMKLRLLDTDDSVVFREDLRAEQGHFDHDALRAAIGVVADQIDAVGHRVVHGGTRFTGPVVIDQAVERALGELTDLAPLHQSMSLAGIDAVRDVLNEIPAVACFDTAFHATLPAVAATYAVPAEWRERFGIRRYGFHGLSHSYASRRAADLVDCPIEELRIVTCHLGAGASLAAVMNGVSVDTTMGFTPLEGLVMATRSGTVDPGIVTWLVQHGGLGIDEVADGLENNSGIRALAGTSDLAEVEVAAERGDRRCRFAIELYVYRLRAAIATMASSMDGLDLLVFTGGVGENSASVRAGAVAGLGFLGAHLDERANISIVPDGVIATPGSPVRTVVVSAREDLQIAAEVRSVLTP